MKGFIPVIVIAALMPFRATAGLSLPDCKPATVITLQDTTGIYGERKDSLDAAVFTSRQEGNYLARGKELRT